MLYLLSQQPTVLFINLTFLENNEKNERPAQDGSDILGQDQKSTMNGDFF